MTLTLRSAAIGAPSLSTRGVRARRRLPASAATNGAGARGSALCGRARNRTGRSAERESSVCAGLRFARPMRPERGSLHPVPAPARSRRRRPDVMFAPSAGRGRCASSSCSFLSPSCDARVTCADAARPVRVLAHPAGLGVLRAVPTAGYATAQPATNSRCSRVSSRALRAPLVFAHVIVYSRQSIR